MRKNTISNLAIILAIATSVSLVACQRSVSPSADEGNTSAYQTEPTPKTEFEQQLKFVRDAHFKYIWIFTRQDGRAFAKEDSDVLHTNAPKVVHWVAANEGKTFIAGSNFEIDPPQMAVLQKRYKIEDYSGK